MTGKPEHNFPLFMEAAGALRAMSYTVANPAEWEDDAPYDASLECYMRRDLPEVAQADGIALLPDWQNSTGACRELLTARFTGRLMLEYNPDNAKLRLLDVDAVDWFGVFMRAGQDWLVFAQDEAAPAPAPGGEVIKTDPKTGGSKGVKLARVDLVPFLAVAKMRQRVSTAGMSAYRSLDPLEYLSYFAQGATPEVLIDGAAVCAVYLEDASNNKLTNGGLPHALWVLAEVFGVGAQKYADRNAERGYPWGWSIGACGRHLLRHQQGETIDPESGQPHIAHALWHFLMLYTFVTFGIGTDDRTALRSKEIA